MSRGTRLAALLIGLAMLAAPLGAAEAPVPKRPTVLLVTLDTLRSDRVSCYGHGRRTTPVIDRLAGEGLLFREALATVPLTTPSHVSIFTGLHPRSHAVLGNSWRLGDSFTTLAERFRDAGYSTAAFVSAVVLDPRCGLDRGFGHYSGIPRPGPNAGLNTPRPEGPPGENGGPARSSRMAGRQRRGQETVDEALAWMAGQRDGKPLFVWVHLYDPHQPYDPPEPYRELFGAERGERNLSTVLRPGFDEPEFDHQDERAREGQERHRERFPRSLQGRRSMVMAGSLTGDERQRIDELYDGEVAYTDFQVGRLLAWLKGQGLYEGAVVAVMGDHGETLGEHHEYYGHHHVLYDTSLLIPMAIRLPGAARGRVSPGVATPFDVTPTLLQAAGLPLMVGLDGRDLLAATAGRPLHCETYLGVRPRNRPEGFERRPDALSREGRMHSHAVRDGRWKLMLAGDTDTPPKLFDLEADPGEQADVSGSHQDLTKALLKHWQRWCETHPLPQRDRGRQRDPAVDAEMREKLRALGYVE
jgi:arylsulfatase A-like enzyme